MSRSRLLRTLGGLGVAALAAAGLSACVGTPGGIQAPDSWTVLTYEIADTNLEPFMMQDVEEMGQVGSKPGFNLISFIDRAEGYTDTPVLGLPDWTGAKWLQVEPGGTANVLQDFGPVDTGDPALLADFIRESILKFPAAHYALIISDHGASWPGVGGDESADYDTLTLDELNQGIGDGLAGAGVDKLDLLGFDACLMATYEVGSVMAAHADRMVASQELEPGHGWDYTALEAAYRGESVDDVGKAIIDGFHNQALHEGTENEITLALIDLTKFSEVDTAVSAFAKAMTSRVSDVAPTVGRTLAQTLGFGTNPDPRYDTQMKDLAILAGEISVDALDVADEADNVVRAVNDVVLDKVDGQATRGATGLSIYFPPDGQLYNPNYSAV
ncbi:MAG: clostripain-related cysteine peptidase, partial [Pseudolysinimonas sp.]